MRLWIPDIVDESVRPCNSGLGKARVGVSSQEKKSKENFP